MTRGSRTIRLIWAFWYDPYTGLMSAKTFNLNRKFRLILLSIIQYYTVDWSFVGWLFWTIFWSKRLDSRWFLIKWIRIALKSAFLMSNSVYINFVYVWRQIEKSFRMKNRQPWIQRCQKICFGIEIWVSLDIFRAMWVSFLCSNMSIKCYFCVYNRSNRPKCQ